MPRRRAKKTVKQPAPSPGPIIIDDEDDPQIEPSLIDQDLERQIGAIKARRDVEFERLRTRLRLVRAYYNEQQVDSPVLQFFNENFPNISVVEKDEKLEVQWKGKDGSFLCGGDDDDVRASLLQGLFAAYPDCSSFQSHNGFELSSNAVRTSFFGAENPPMKDFVLEGPSESHLLGMQDGLQTPGVSSQRLSIGMTPKTLRLPKPGEMLLSVRGSPLGVYNYKEDNMEAIHESEEG